MLGIKRDDGDWDSWWLGCKIPESAKGRVATFQADGDELNMILQVMNATRYTVNGVGYGKFEGLFNTGSTPATDIPKCPKCGSYKLSCHKNGCTWEIPLGAK